MLKKITFLIALMWYGVAARAQTALTLGDVLTQGVAASKLLRADKAKIEAALAKYEQVRANLYPQVKLNAGYTRLSDVPAFKVQFPGAKEAVTLFPVILDSWQGRASVQQAIFTGFRAKYAEQSAKLLQQATVIDAEKDVDEVKLNLIATFLNLYKIAETNRLLATNEKQATQRLTEVKNMVKQGTLLPNDELRANLQLEQVKQAVLELRNNETIASYNLGLMLDKDLSAGVTADTSGLFDGKMVGDLNTYLAQSITNRQEVKASELRLRASENAVKSTKGAYLPTVSVGGNFYYGNPNQRYLPNTAEFKSTWDAGVNVSWDIANMFTNKHNVHEADAVFIANKIGIEQLQDAVKMDVNQAFMNYQTALSKINLFKLNIAQATENLRVTNNRFQQNTILLSDVLDADALLLQSKINYATAKADAELAYYKLMKAGGNL